MKFFSLSKYFNLFLKTHIAKGIMVEIIFSPPPQKKKLHLCVCLMFFSVLKISKFNVKPFKVLDFFKEFSSYTKKKMFDIIKICQLIAIILKKKNFFFQPMLDYAGKLQSETGAMQFPVQGSDIFQKLCRIYLEFKVCLIYVYEFKTSFFQKIRILKGNKWNMIALLFISINKH